MFDYYCAHIILMRLRSGQYMLDSILQLFEVPLENSEALLRYASALVQGASNIFWYGF